MKKNVLLVLLSCFALTGCSFSMDSLKFWEKSEDNQQKGDGPGDPQTPPDDNKPQDHVAGTYTATISLGNDVLRNKLNATASYQFDDTSHASHVSDLKNYCASQLDATNMLTSLSCVNCNTMENGNDLHFSLGTGFYQNNKFNEGTFTWTSALPIHRIEISAMAYSKKNSGGSTDGQSVVWIDDESHSLAHDTDTVPTPETFSREYPSGVKTFQLKSTGSRVFLESITLTWNFLYEAD